ncbi:Interferon-induced protein 44 [Nibea albiflora]|nr:Interferon-induced protein 44 [Nibea albiflora]
MRPDSAGPGPGPGPGPSCVSMKSDWSMFQAPIGFKDGHWSDDQRDNHNILQYLTDYKPQTNGQKLRILLHGPVGAGKSSFINSVQSALQGRIYRQAFANNISHDSFTKKYSTYKIEKGGSESFYPFVFNDIMGLDTDKGVLVGDVKLALRGHVKDGYTDSPSNNDKVHVLVCVVPASTVSLITDEAVRKIREIRKEASDLGIPQLAVITKIDEVCPEMEKDVKNVYKSKLMKAKTQILTTGSCYKSCFEQKVWPDSVIRDNQSVLQYLKDYKPQTEGQKLRILLHGPVGAGKSSFINSVRSVLQGKISARAGVDNSGADYSFTKKYTTYKVPKGGPERVCSFVFNDIMGLEIKGVHVDDVKLALKGRVKDGYRFNPESKMSEQDQFYNNSPSDNDKVHVLVCVVPASTVAHIKDEVVQKIRDIREEASDLGISQLAVITKIDEVCPEMKQDVKNVYKLKAVKAKMEEFSVKVGIPMNCIFPVKNYHEENNVNSDIDSLILDSLKNMINFGDEFLDEDKQSPLQAVNDYRPRTEGLQLRILLHGLEKAGKSSFINSVSTALQGNMSRIAVVGNSDSSVTKEYKTHRIQKGNQNDFYPFVLNDIMGMRNATRRNRRVRVKDVKRVMKGHFNPERNIIKGGEFYIRNPTANDKVHVLVSVIDADMIQRMEKEVQETLQDIREEAIDLGILEVAVVTKIDTVCPEIKQDIKNVYRSRTLKKRMELLSANVGIPMNCIFPVKNYHEELQPNNDTDVLILNALTNIIKVGEAFLNQNNPA